MKLAVEAETLLLLVTPLVELGTPRFGSALGDRLGNDVVPVTLPLPYGA